MDLTYPPDAEDVPHRDPGWLEENLPAGWFDADFEMTPEERAAFNEAWPAKLYGGGWICATWPKEYGGKGLIAHAGRGAGRGVRPGQGAAAGRLLRRHAGGPHDPAVGHRGAEAGVPARRSCSGEMRWCQGFSEPDSGSDLASLKTTAVLDGDEWVINGQKVWTTQAQFADYCFLLARTDPDVEKQAGISYLLVPMKQPGVEVRPITQPDGTAEFNEVFFADARCPEDNVVGGLNNGWAVANTTLGFERGQSATTGYRRFEEELRLMIEAAQANGAIDDPLIRQRLAEYYSKIQIIRINGLRTLTVAVTGRKDPAVGALGATNKMWWSEMHKEAMELALDIFGADARCWPTAAPPSGSWPAAMRGAASAPGTGEPDGLGLLLQPVRDDLGRHRRRSSATSSARRCWASRRSPRPPPSEPLRVTVRRRTGPPVASLDSCCLPRPPERRGRTWPQRLVLVAGVVHGRRRASSPPPWPATSACGSSRSTASTTSSIAAAAAGRAGQLPARRHGQPGGPRPRRPRHGWLHRRRRDGLRLHRHDHGAAGRSEGEAGADPVVPPRPVDPDRRHRAEPRASTPPMPTASRR